MQFLRRSFSRSISLHELQNWPRNGSPFLAPRQPPLNPVGVDLVPWTTLTPRAKLKLNLQTPNTQPPDNPTRGHPPDHDWAALAPRPHTEGRSSGIPSGQAKNSAAALPLFAPDLYSSPPSLTEDSRAGQKRPADDTTAPPDTATINATHADYSNDRRPRSRGPLATSPSANSPQNPPATPAGPGLL